MERDAWKDTSTIYIPEEAIKQTLEHSERPLGERSVQFVEDKPFLVAGLLGLTAVCVYGAHKWKTRQVKPSVFLMQLRVVAQGTALGFITLGMAYNMYKDYIQNKKS